MGIFTTALRNKKIRQILKKKYLTLLPQCIICYLTAYFDEKSPFKRVVHFEVFNVHKKSPLNENRQLEDLPQADFGRVHENISFVGKEKVNN